MLTLEQYEQLIREDKYQKRHVSRRLKVIRGLHRRFILLTSTAERKQYHYRPELDILQEWTGQHSEGLQNEIQRLNKRILIANGLKELRRIEYLAPGLFRHNDTWEGQKTTKK